MRRRRKAERQFKNSLPGFLIIPINYIIRINMAETKNTTSKPQEYKQKLGTSLQQDREPSLSQSRRELDEQYKTSQEQTGPSLAESEEEREYMYQLELARAQQRMADDEETARLEEESQKPVPMGWILFLFMFLITVILDIIDIFTGGTVGWFIGIFGDLLLLAVTGISKAGRKQFKRIIIGLLGDSIPIVAFLPIRSIFLIWAFMSSRPKLMSGINKILKIASKIPSPIQAQLKVASKVSNVATAAAQQGNGDEMLKGASAIAKGVQKLKK